MRLSVRLDSLIRSLTTLPALVAGAAVCYAAVFGLLVYGIAFHARLASWRQPPLPTTATFQPVKPSAPALAASCAELAGMDQKLCNAEARVDAARAKYQQRVAARKQRHVRPPADRTKSAPKPPAQMTVPPAEFPDEVEPLKLSVAIHE